MRLLITTFVLAFALLGGHAAHAQTPSLLEECLSLKDYPKRVEVCTKVVQESSDPAQKAEALQRRAVAYEKLGLAAQAYQDYKQAVQITEGTAQADMYWNILGSYQKHMGQCDAAIASFQQAMRLKPLAHYAYNTGACQHTLGKTQDAAQSFRQAMSMDPKLQDAYLGLALMLKTMGNTAEARTIAAQGLQLNGRVAGKLQKLLQQLGS